MTRVQNISYSGLLLRTGEPLPINSLIMLEFSPPETPDTYRVISRVKRVRQLPGTKTFHVGSQFIDFTAEESSALADSLIRKHEPDWVAA